MMKSTLTSSQTAIRMLRGWRRPNGLSQGPWFVSSSLPNKIVVRFCRVFESNPSVLLVSIHVVLPVSLLSILMWDLDSISLQISTSLLVSKILSSPLVCLLDFSSIISSYLSRFPLVTSVPNRLLVPKLIMPIGFLPALAPLPTIVIMHLPRYCPSFFYKRCQMNTPIAWLRRTAAQASVWSGSVGSLMNDGPFWSWRFLRASSTSIFLRI